MTTVDLSAIQFYLPLLSFLLVFIVVYAVLAKTKILGENKFVQLLSSFIAATIFVSATAAREYVLSVTPWFAVFAVAVVFVFALMQLTGKVPKSFTKGVGIVFIVALLLLFLIFAYFAISPNASVEKIYDWVSTPKVYGAILLVAVGAIASWVLIKVKD